MSEDFEAQPAYMSAMQFAQEGVSTAITTAFSVVTPGALSGFASAIGPLGVANVIPAFFASTSNHALLGTSTEVAQAGYVKVDEGAGSGPTTAV